MSQIAHTGYRGEQLALFPGICAPGSCAATKPRRTRSRGLKRITAKAVQFALDLRARVSDAAEEWADRWASRPIVHAIVPASQTRMPETRAPASVFDLGCQMAARQVIAEFMMAQDDQASPQPRPAPIQEQAHTRIMREAGVTRCQRIHHTDTQEWQEREAARRARQRPPKPTKKAKTMSSKLTDLVGAGHGA